MRALPPRVEASQIWQRLQPLTLALAAALQARGEALACAESCTGGLLSALCTDLPGSSVWFDRAWVTYSNAAKAECLGVPEAIIEAQQLVISHMRQDVPDSRLRSCCQQTDKPVERLL